MHLNVQLRYTSIADTHAHNLVNKLNHYRDRLKVVQATFSNKKHLKNVGPIRHNEPPHAHSPDVASGTVRTACASMSTTTTTTTTRDRGDRYGPMERAQ